MVSKKERVLKVLGSMKWTPGYILTQPDIGGSEGLRRLRELREDGYQIKIRHMENSNAYEYRLVRKTPVSV